MSSEDIEARGLVEVTQVDNDETLLLRALLCLSGFAGEGLQIVGFEDPADLYSEIAVSIGMEEADDDDLRAHIEIERSHRLTTPTSPSAAPLESREKFDGVGPHDETIETRARIGERYLEAYEGALHDPLLRGYGPADCPSELLLDLLERYRVATSPSAAPDERIREAARICEDTADRATHLLDREERTWRPSRGHFEGLRNALRNAASELRAALTDTPQPALANPGNPIGEDANAAEVERWRANVRYLLDNEPTAVRVHEGGATVEDLIASLSISWLKLQQAALTPPANRDSGEAGRMRALVQRFANRMNDAADRTGGPAVRAVKVEIPDWHALMALGDEARAALAERAQ